MSNYRRLISYIYAYEGGVKGKNIGFAKIEARNGQCKINANVKKVYVGSNDTGVYLLTSNGEIFIGKIFIRSGAGEFRTVVKVDNVEGSGNTMDDCYGLTIHDVKNNWQNYTTIWEDAVTHAAEVELADVTSENMLNQEEDKRQQEAAMEELRQEVHQEQVQQEQAQQEQVQQEQVRQEQVRQDLVQQEQVYQEQVEQEQVQLQPKQEYQVQEEQVQRYQGQNQENAAESDSQINSAALPVSEQEVKLPSGAEDVKNIQAEIPQPQSPPQSQPQSQQSSPIEDILKRRMAEARPWEKSIFQRQYGLQNVNLQQPGPRQVQREADQVQRPTVPPQMEEGSQTKNQIQQEAAKPAQSQQEVPLPAEPKEEPEVLEKGDTETNMEILWSSFRKKYPKIQAFEYENGCEILSIKPQDIGLLPRENWGFGNNSFLLHGFYNYRYLILVKLNNPSGKPRYLLGVPGHYFSSEKNMASMFGFPHFVLSSRQPVDNGKFGYWYTEVRQGH